MNSELKQAIHKAKVVSFDIFDTVIVRLLRKPADLFMLVELAGGQASAGFAAKRIEAETQARRRPLPGGQTRHEIELHDIYRELAEISDWPADQLSHLQELEVKLEYLFCRRNEYMYQVYRYCVLQGKTVIFTSDMYLSADVISDILHRNGYTDYAKLYLSSEVGLTKHHGALYQHITEDSGRSAAEFLHIGDHPLSDLKRAKEAGWAAYAYHKTLDYVNSVKPFVRTFSELLTKPDIRPEETVLLGLLLGKLYTERNVDAGGSFWYRFGYETIGVLLYGFVHWVKSKAEQDGAEQLFFLSRDGYIMKQVYDIITAGDPDALPAAYIYASRRAYNFPAVADLGEENLRFLLSYSADLTVAQYLERVGLRSADYESQARQAGFRSLADRVGSEKEQMQIRTLYSLIEQDILAAAADERVRLARYLKQTGMLDCSRPAIVDIGWHGTMQQALDQVLKLIGQGDTQISGYYLGTFAKAHAIKSKGHQMNGFLCDTGLPEQREAVILKCVELFEFLFTAPHGSVTGFQEKDGKMEPVFDPNDNDDQKLEAARLMHEGVLDFVRDMQSISAALELPLSVSPDLAIAPIARVLHSPTRLEADKIGDLTHAKGFGDVYVSHALAKPPERVFSPKGLKQLQFGFRRSLWKEGYKRRVPEYHLPFLLLVETAMRARHSKKFTVRRT
ncbi:HAD family hydrolase [Paenibacillus sp. CN-4]|uniref:HAD family hydrolase n=1 Tax=Paenibacillus nanchangensis TaxID=3348343 RepID=UPI00397E3015